MCGRYSLAPSSQQKAEQLSDIRQPVSWKIRYNIAPTQSAYVITNDVPSQIQEMTWGLIPSWSSVGANNGKLINARAESIFEKPSFRDIIQSRRCLVLADSFYEWRKEPDGRKLPFRILLNNGALMFMAGIWDRRGTGSTAQTTFSIITTGPNEEMTALHNRMPLILPTSEAQARWLSELSVEKIVPMLERPANGLLRMYRVSERLNATTHDDQALQGEVPDVLRLF